MKTETILLLGAAALGAYFLFFRNASAASSTVTASPVTPQPLGLPPSRVPVQRTGTAPTQNFPTLLYALGALPSPQSGYYWTKDIAGSHWIQLPIGAVS